ncbi:MAG: class I SAM-dependent methyltransferase [Pseudomonadota bacterium]
MDTKRKLKLFLKLHAGLPRQGPGGRASTLRALQACTLPAAPQVLDVGSGPGMQTLDLATQLSDARIIATDLHLNFLKELGGRHQLPDASLQRVCADMRKLPFGERQFDLIWCEGAAYIMGVANALAAWKPVLKNTGYIAFTENVWLHDQPPEPIRSWWHAAYPAMSGMQQVADLCRAAGFEVVEQFALPDSDWWADYYEPLAANVAQLRDESAGDSEALEVAAAGAEEIHMRQQYGEHYSYAFFVLRNSQAA